MKYALELAIIAAAIIGGAARYLEGYQTDGVFNWRKFLAHLVVSAFTGWTFARFMIFLGVTPDIAGVMAGIGGWLGPKAIEFVVDRLGSSNKD